MSFYNNEKHFLHEYLTQVESLDMEGGNNGFESYLKNLGIQVDNSQWEIDHSIINWPNTENFHQFYFDFEGSEKEISNWLEESPISKYSNIITWLDYKDPIIRIQTSQFINHWEKLNVACAWSGLIATTEDGKCFLEFTDDWKCHLNSNFQIKPGSKR